MLRKSEIPDKPRFSLASSRAYELLIELDICSFPVEPRKIIKHFSNWFLTGYLELKHNTGDNDPLSLKKEQAEAKTVKIRNTDEYLIIYDEQVNNESRIRWTLAHEIGHIVLGHLDHFEFTALNRRGLSKKEYSVLEVEAHWFAAELLSPKPIMKRFSFGDSSDGISLICDISKEASKKRFTQIKYEDYGYFTNADKLLRNFYHHISSKGYLDAIFETASRYQGTHIYPDLCKYCRVCSNCNAFIDEEDEKFCHICGAAIPDIYCYSPIKFQKGTFHIGWDFMLKGKYYRDIETNDNKRLVFCPICKNHEFSDEAQHCRICGTPLFNRCKKEDKILDASYRHCPDCGSETEYKELYNSLPQKANLDSFIDLPIDLDDYIEYEYWDFLQMVIGYWEKNIDLFIALANSSAFRDGTDFVILVNNKMELDIVNAGRDVISNSLQKYGNAVIEKVRCYSVI